MLAEIWIDNDWAEERFQASVDHRKGNNTDTGGATHNRLYYRDPGKPETFCGEFSRFRDEMGSFPPKFWKFNNDFNRQLASLSDALQADPQEVVIRL